MNEATTSHVAHGLSDALIGSSRAMNMLDELRSLWIDKGAALHEVDDRSGSLIDRNKSLGTLSLSYPVDFSCTALHCICFMS